MIRGVRLRFSIEEFALITGLDCEGDCSVLDFKQEVNSLCERYWPTSSSITKESVRECFTTKRWGDSDEDAVKLAVLYFVEWFLLSGTKHKNVPKSILDVVDSGRYNEFAWGRSSFELTISSLKGKLDSWVEGVRKARSSGKRPSVFYTLIGCPHVLQVWFYECCKYMKGKYCQKESSRIPRITQWTCNSQPTFKVLKTTIFDVSKDKLQLSNMRPTTGEFKALNRAFQVRHRLQLLQESSSSRRANSLLAVTFRQASMPFPRNFMGWRSRSIRCILPNEDFIRFG
ncbi:uncharacterized protein LOC133039174 [Cannabis sativa]|uniref:uncharacterized protein LOC133039174 n=1 Tax=Cannabis sativa TaxID=3483 RepID=UPI0029CA5C80|nr:uncharacterized protein LOC133039174 [Cannabis sativa]